MTPGAVGQHRAIAAVVVPDPTVELHADLAANPVTHGAELQRHRRPDARQHRQRHGRHDRRRLDHLARLQGDGTAFRVDRLHRTCQSHAVAQPGRETGRQLIVAPDDAMAFAAAGGLQPSHLTGEPATDLLGRQHVLGADLAADHQARQHRHVERVHEVGERLHIAVSADLEIS